MFEDLQNKEFLQEAERKQEFKKEFKKPHCILLDSEYSSMGRMIAARVCEQIGYTYYDAKKLLDLLGADETVKAQSFSYDAFLCETAMTPGELSKTPDFIFISGQYQRAMELALSKGPCLIHERGIMEQVTALNYSVFAILCYGDYLPSKRVRTKTSPVYKHLTTDEELDAAIEKEDQKRRLYHDALSSRPWGLKESYDLCLNTETLGKDSSIRLLVSLLS